MSCNDWKELFDIIGIIIDKFLIPFLPVIIIALQFIFFNKREINYQKQTKEMLTTFDAKINQKSYVSKVQFDKELEFLMELSEKSANSVDMAQKCFSVKYLVGNDITKNEQEKYYKDILHNAVESYNKFLYSFRKCAPFIDDGIFNKFNDLKYINDSIITIYKNYLSNDNYLESPNSNYTAGSNEVKKIVDTQTELISLIRQYFVKMRVGDRIE